ncbi:MAG: hypothetical protein ACRBBW_13150 [Cellvibrionaceae bacterium]
MAKPARKSAHESREQESREHDDLYDLNEPIFEDTGPLPEVPARDGYAQRWIRIQKGNEEDGRNIYAASRKGWTPRSLETVGDAFKWLTTKLGDRGNLVGTKSMVLMERPIELDRRASQVTKGRRQELEKAVKQNLFSEHNGLGGSSTGFTAPQVESASQVERGQPLVADD